MMLGDKPFDIDEIDELADDATFGVAKVADYSWKALLDFSSCTECGRCQDVCPAWATGKPLSPKLFTLAQRDHASGDDDIVPLVIDPDVLWSCTTCGACVDACPVDIEHVDHILDLRRNETMTKGEFPEELGDLFHNLEVRGNPWGLPARARLDWTKTMDFPIPVLGKDIKDLADVDYLFWVGCAGAYDNKARRTTQALAELLRRADVTFAILGTKEKCTGDSARRAGNEALFQTMAKDNIATLTKFNATRIIVSCAHCFNTLANEYPALGGAYEVVHHTQLLDHLVNEGRLTPEVAAETPKITYHDPCYLARHNGVVDEPRGVLAALPGAELVEMPCAGKEAFCCGAGGAQMWTEETIGTRINNTRAAQAAETGAGVVATGCPFCATMLTDGCSANKSGVAVFDVAELLLASLPALSREPTQT